ncbi:FMN-dependent NADH-azoreductase [Actinophytocola gossypii]|uniref:FMN dependent NADH:quinone oxidoreductase n=1 Tax=Actinophytocola gossypii TaxID=2812003 RepID=A0ABT2J4B3_9PSEU|nr:NAD(P)H-dependent oxidoreductase [Actinophytocola gossypii]MCT2582601.1 NAD(P)H-dependent oxidoreductase [Actinophytocola gossypii]
MAPLNLLHLDSSARANSFSRRLGRTFADAWASAHPNGHYVHRDLAATPVPPIGQGWTEICDELLRRRITDPTRYPDAVRTAAQREAWAVVRPLLDELLAADVVLIGAPMYNFSIPASLKAWIDQVTFPRMSLAPRTFVVAGARGGSYLPGTPRFPFDHHESYLRDFIDGHYGVDDVTFVNAELVNALVDPTLEPRTREHEESAATATARVPDVVADITRRRARP